MTKISKKGRIFISSDLLDFSVIHLSAYERSMREMSLNDVDGPFINRLLGVSALQKDRYKRRQKTSVNDGRYHTIAIMPWFGSTHKDDAGHSNVAMRLNYLKASFYSIAAVFPAVVIGVANEADRDRVLEELSLPVLDILVLPHAQERPKELPFLTIKEVQKRLRENINGWKERFRYLFYTESDQLLVIRDEYKLFEQLETHKWDVIMPHRLIAYSHELLRSIHVRGLHSLPVLSSQPANNASIRAWECRVTTVACSGNRSDFVPIRTLRKWSTLPLLNVDGLLVIFGHANYRRHLFRPCQLQRKVV